MFVQEDCKYAHGLADLQKTEGSGDENVQLTSNSDFDQKPLWREKRSYITLYEYQKVILQGGGLKYRSDYELEGTGPSRQPEDEKEQD